MSLFSDDEKAYLGSLFEELHDTWKRKVFVYKNDDLVVVSQDPNYISQFGVRNAANVSRTVEKKEFEVRIQHKTQQTIAPVTGPDDTQLKQKTEDGRIRIRCGQEAYEYMKDAKKFEVDGIICELVTSGRPHGLFVNDYYDFHLKRIN